MYKLIDSDAQLAKFTELLLNTSPVIALDTECTSLFHGDKVTGCSISWSKGNAIYISLRHQDSALVSRSAFKTFLQAIKSLKIVYHNSLYDRLMLFTNYGILLPFHADTQIYAYLLGEDKGLKDLSFKFLNIKQVEFRELLASCFGKSWNKLGYNISHISTSNPDLLNYACDDANCTLQLYNIFKPLMTPFKSILKIEENIVTRVMKMNYIGAPVDLAMLDAAIIDYEVYVEELYEEITKIAGRKVLLNSTRDLPKFLFEELGLPVLERSRETGAPSTSKEVLAKLRDLHPVVSKIADWRADSRMLTGYLKKISGGVEKGRIFTSFNNTGAVSGRFTSSSVEDVNGLVRGLNLQNIPKHKKRKIDMRAAFIAPPGYTFLKADYSQIEYRVMANLSGDEYMIKSFLAGLDFHVATAAAMYEIDPALVTDEMRDMGKVFNFGISYGMTTKGLAMRLGVAEAEAERKIEHYFSKLPGLVNFIDTCYNRGQVEGATYTFFGRKRALDLAGIPARYHKNILRRAFNTTVQGTAADLLKIAIIRVGHQVLDVFKQDVEMIMTVHDELCFLVKTERGPKIALAIKRAMEIPVQPGWAPIVVDIGYGPNWSEESHTKFIAPADYKAEEFSSWGAVLPNGLTSSLEEVNAA